MMKALILYDLNHKKALVLDLMLHNKNCNCI